MKSLVILGVPRAGKSNLSQSVAHHLASKGNTVSLVSADAVIGGLTAQRNTLLWRIFVRPLRHLFPWIRRKSRYNMVRRMKQFVGRFVNESADNTVVIFEGAYITPNEALEIFDVNKCKIVVVGYPNAKVDDKVAEIRKYDKRASYIACANDKEIKEKVAYLVELSKIYQKQSKGKFTFLDTSTDYHGTLDKFVNNVTEFLGDQLSK